MCLVLVSRCWSSITWRALPLAFTCSLWAGCTEAAFITFDLKEVRDDYAAATSDADDDDDDAILAAWSRNTYAGDEVTITPDSSDIFFLLFLLGVCALGVNVFCSFVIVSLTFVLVVMVVLITVIGPFVVLTTPVVVVVVVVVVGRGVMAEEEADKEVGEEELELATTFVLCTALCECDALFTKNEFYDEDEEDDKEEDKEELDHDDNDYYHEEI